MSENDCSPRKRYCKADKEYTQGDNDLPKKLKKDIDVRCEAFPNRVKYQPSRRNISFPIMIKKGILLGYGNPLLDISVQAQEDYLAKYDLKADNAILAEDKHQPMYEEIPNIFTDVDYVPGGAALNTIRVAQLLLKEPNATSFMGCIAHDKYGDILTKEARDVGVDVKFQYTDKAPTGTCAVICTGRCRSLVANLAAANCFSEDHLDNPEIWAAVEAANFIYFGGYPLTVCPQAMLRIAKFASENNKTVLMNMSAPFLCTFFKEPMLKMLPYADYWFGNESEALEFAKANDLGTDDIKEIAIKLAQWDKVNKSRSRIVVITQGVSPAIVAQDDKATEYDIIPIKQEDIVDSNGAGDSFVGGFLSELVQGKDLESCMKKGHEVANKCLQNIGCTFRNTPL
ncbi:adenosine kinase [Biomphalaria glabrata]|nr:adenosine kinase [Biomphalaria glabrata]